MLGSEKQSIPWIHIADLCMTYKYGLENDNISGTFNAVSNDYQTNESLTKHICSELKRPFWLMKIPSIIMKLAFGKMSVILLKGSRVSAEKIKKDGFVYRYSDLKNALANLLR